ncbi:hypothetical protein SPHG1_26 [Salmonella phage SPHG1]|nr:hypothetical protein SPHG1_26 [Salmonella phage SPHG1]
MFVNKYILNYNDDSLEDCTSYWEVIIGGEVVFESYDLEDCTDYIVDSHNQE